MSEIQIVRKSQYRHIAGKLWTKKETHENIRSGVGVNLSNFIKSNGEMFAIPFKRAGGCIAYRKCLDFGKWSDEPQHWIQAHKKALSDFEFCPFADAGNLLATASNDEPVKLWKLNTTTSAPAPAAEPTMQLEPHASLPVTSNVTRVGFHPLASRYMYTSQPEGLHFWDVNKQQVALKVAIPDKNAPMEGISFNYNANQVLASSKDKKIRLYDLVSNKMIMEQEAHQSAKPYSTFFLDHSNAAAQNGRSTFAYLFSVGFSKGGDREFAMWDARKFDTALTRHKMDYPGGPQTVLYDADIRVLYLAGKGDGCIRYFEIDNVAPYCFELNSYESQTPQTAVCMLPKTSCNVSQFELARFLKHTDKDVIETISFKVSRHENIANYFQEDIFPNTWDHMPIDDNKDWLTTMSDESIWVPHLKSLKPEDKVSIYDVPAEQGGKVRPTLTTTTTAVASPDSPVSPISTDLSSTTTTSEPSSPVPTTTTAKNALPSALAAGFGIVDLHLKRVANGETSNNTSTTTTTTTTAKSTTTVVAQAKGSAGVQWYMFIWKGIVYIGVAIWYLLKMIMIPFRKQQPPATTTTSRVQELVKEKNAQEQQAFAKTIQVPLKKNTAENTTTTTTSTTDAKNTIPPAPPAPPAPPIFVERSFEERVVSAYEQVTQHITVTDQDLKIPAHERDPSLSCEELDLNAIKKGKQPVLLKVKGRRQLRVSLVPFQLSSLTLQDAFILDCGPIIYQFTGNKANKIAPPKASEVANTIRTKDRGANANLVYVEYGKELKDDIEKRNVLKFWRIMCKDDALSSVQEAEARIAKQFDTIDEDDYAKTIVDPTLRIYQYNEEAQSTKDKLIEVDLERNGTLPSYIVLQAKHCYLVCERHGMETYVWTGKDSTIAARNYALALARKYADYAAKQNKYASVLRVFENGEPAMFKQKFCDFPGQSQMIQTAPPPPPASLVAAKPKEAIQLDFKEMLAQRSKLKSVRLLNPKNKPVNEVIKMWRIDKHDMKPYVHVGHFFSHDAYIIYYKYDKNEGGKTYHKIFFWQGADVRKQDKGTVAFKTVEVAVDLKDTSQQIRVLQGKEQRSFFRLFAHKYIVHLGNYDARMFKDAMAASTPMVDMSPTTTTPSDNLVPEASPSPASPTTMIATNNGVRIYDVRYVHSGETEEQESIHAVQCNNYYTLHAHHAAIIVAEPFIYMWIGKYAPAAYTTHYEQLRAQFEQLFVGYAVQPIEKQGQESNEFGALLTKSTTLLQVPSSIYQFGQFSTVRMGTCTMRPRLFKIDESAGQFTMVDVTSTSAIDEKKNKNLVKSSFSNAEANANDPIGADYLQIDAFAVEDLESDKCYLLDDVYTSTVYCWIGKCVSVGVKVFALQATLDYAEACCKAETTTTTIHTCYAVQEHEEPLEFVHIFTAWNETCQNVLSREAVLKQQASNSSNETYNLLYKNNKVCRPNVQQVKLVKDELDRLQTKTYSLARLREVPLPEGVDATKKEDYLHDSEFVTLFGMTRQEFAAMPPWKKGEKKKAVNFF